jgi:ribosomal protein S18 acetylase RimI-like enzyme
MEPLTDLKVVLIPKEYAEPSMLESVAKAFRELRLQALYSDPASFSSSYTSESQRPFSFWTKRLQNPQAKTFALVHSNTKGSGQSNSESPPHRRWLGMLVLLGPKAVERNAYENGSTWKTLLTESSSRVEVPKPADSNTGVALEESSLIYHIVAVYVASEARGRGLAKSLLANTLATIEHESREMGFGNAICTLGAAEENVAARKTYEAMEFVPVAEDHVTTDDGREFHETVMRRDFKF